jgi:hypothetical protein
MLFEIFAVPYVYIATVILHFLFALVAILFNQVFIKLMHKYSLTMSSAMDNLGDLIERLKHMINDIQDQYESFIDSNQLYEQGKVNEREFFASIGNYLVAMSGMNFLAIQVIFEIKSAIEKKKSPNNVRSGPDNLGIGGFTATGKPIETPQYNLSKLPQWQHESQQQDRIESTPETRQTSIKNTNCTTCGAVIPKQSKFCSKCGSRNN